MLLVLTYFKGNLKDKEKNTFNMSYSSEHDHYVTNLQQAQVSFVPEILWILSHIDLKHLIHDNFECYWAKVCRYDQQSTSCTQQFSLKNSVSVNFKKLSTNQNGETHRQRSATEDKQALYTAEIT